MSTQTCPCCRLLAVEVVTPHGLRCWACSAEEDVPADGAHCQSREGWDARGQRLGTT